LQFFEIAHKSLGEFHLFFSSALPHPGAPFIFTGSSILISTLSLFFFYLTSSSNHWRRSFFFPAFFLYCIGSSGTKLGPAA
jgi:hypothetical protein